MKLPAVSGSETLQAFRKVGYEIDEQHGSHMILPARSRRTEPLGPNHKELARNP